MELTDKKPLVFFDLETTGTNIQTDRIVELSLVKLMPDGTREVKTRRLNPEMPIPEEASAVHHIYDADVADEPTFRQVSKNLFIYLEGCDLGGYNIAKFDIPLLVREFSRCGLQFTLADRRIVDAYTIFCRMEPRSLTAAYKFFCGKTLEGAHGAEADTLASLEVYESQLKRYSDPAYTDFPEGVESFPDSVDAIHEFCTANTAQNIDLAGRFKWKGSDAIIAFGRHANRTLREIAVEQPDFLRWIIRSDFADDVKKIASDALCGIFPEKKN